MPCLHSSNLLPRGLEGCVCMDGEEGKTTYFLGYDAVGRRPPGHRSGHPPNSGKGDGWVGKVVGR